MSDIVDNEEIDKDTIETEALERLFESKYHLVTETAVSSKKSYVNKLNGTKSLRLAVGVSNSNSIEVFDPHNSTLTAVCRLSGHEKALTEVVFSPKEDHLLYSSGLDGLVKLWDLRASGSCVQEYKDEEEELLRPYECLDVSCNGRVLCAGSQLVQDDAYLVFWDQRVLKPLGGYWNSHTDDVTHVQFHKEKTEILATGSVDGLMNIYNITEQSEDDALLFSLNIENSVERISWLNSKEASCTTQSNDLQIWNTESGDLVKSFTREKIAKSIKRSKEDDCYLVDTFTSKDNVPVVLAGSHESDVLRSVSIIDKKLQPCANFINNKQVVRCCWYDKDQDTLVTAGEAGIISVWSGGGDTSSEDSDDDDEEEEGEEGEGDAPEGGGPIRGNARDNRHKPY